MSLDNELIKLANVGSILSNIGNNIITNHDLLKLIKFDSKDALSQSNVSTQDIIKLVGRGTDVADQRIFKTPFNSQIVDEVRSELRFFMPHFSPDNLYLSEVIVTFQVIVHNSIWEIDNNKIRSIAIIQELLKMFNGYDVGSIGELQLDGAIKIVAWNSHFTGYLMNFKTRSQ